MKIIIATIRKWHIVNAKKFQCNHPEHDVKLVFDKNDLTIDMVRAFQPEYIMFPHWSWMIPREIFSEYKCIVFHTSDVPDGKGGSPIQNQIADGYSYTMISAIAVDEGLDTGGVYLKRELNLQGGAEEIFIRSSNTIFDEMIPYILDNDLQPKPQGQGGFTYKRRSPEQSVVPFDKDLLKIYDHIRMLDAEDYPHAYLDVGRYRMFFSRAKLEVGRIVADVEIIER